MLESQVFQVCKPFFHHLPSFNQAYEAVKDPEPALDDAPLSDNTQVRSSI